MIKGLEFKQEVNFSAKPRFTFTTKDGKVLTADKVLGKNGVTDGYQIASIDGSFAYSELATSNCREIICSKLGSTFNYIKNRIDYRNIIPNYSGVVELSKNKFHISHGSFELRPATGRTNTAVNSHWDDLCFMLDALCGNTAVLVDRNENLAVAREQDKKPRFVKTVAGIEYNGVTSFYLRAFPLTSLVLGMARHALDLVAQQDKLIESRDYVAKVKSLVSNEDIQKAISNNDFELAYENFKKLEDFIVETAGVGNQLANYPLNSTNIREFHFFITKPMDLWFQEDYYTHWTTGSSLYRRGIETFLTGQVRTEMQKVPIPTVGDIKMVRI